MTCDHCAKTIEKQFTKFNGIVKPDVSYPKAQGEFEFDESQISENEIIEIINKTHYKVTGKIEDDASNLYDLIIIGGGSAAFSAALTAAEKGAEVLIFNAMLPTGGTCVNIGCVPSKNLLRKAEAIHRINHPAFAEISAQTAKFNFKKLIQSKEHLVQELREKKYIDVIKNKENIQLINAFAHFENKNTVIAEGKTYQAKKFIIATGSSTYIPDIKGIDKINYFTSQSLFALETLPQSMTILGAGYIGLEISQMFARMGTKVRILEFTDRPLRSQTPDISKEIQQHLTAEGVEFYSNYRLKECKQLNDGILLIGMNKNNSTQFEMIEKGIVLLATSTQGNTKRLGLEKIGLKTTPMHKISVNLRQETGIEGIYAAGDCTNTPPFVYTAAAEGKIAAQNALGENIEMNYDILPWVVFTDPQVAGAGMDETQAKEKGINAEISKIELKDVPRAIAANDMRGFIKLIRNANTKEIIGIRAVAPEAGELVMAISFAIKAKMKSTEVADMLFPYLTLAEGIKLAAIAFEKDVKELSCCAV